MNLDAVTAELRPRGAWEAADFGARMVRRDAAVIYRVWFRITLPLMAIAMLCILYLPFPGWVQFGYWWLEPLVDGPILYILSRRLFGEDVNARSALRATPALARRNWIFFLTPYRLHFARSLAIPLTQLEGLSGKKRRARAKVLNRTTMNHGIGVTAAYQHLLMALYIGIVLLGFAFVPSAYQDTIGVSWFESFYEADGNKVDAMLGLFVFYIAQSALHPWFVGAGFGLYINCRTILEAWDIEVAFRRILQRRVSRAVAAGALVMMVFIASPDFASAGESELEPWWDIETVESAEERIFNTEALRTTETVEEWISTTVEGEEKPDLDLSGIEGMFSSVGRFVSFLVEIGLWIVVAIVVVIVVLTSGRWLPYLSFVPKQRARRQRIVLASGEITAESLADDIPAAVLTLWRAGERRQALSLLYRGTVFAAVNQHGVRLPGSATEGACVAAVSEQTDPIQAEFFAKIVAAWVWCAYGLHEPAGESVAQLCQEWPSHYGGAAQ